LTRQGVIVRPQPPGYVRLRGWMLAGARLLWLAVALINLYAFISGIPRAYSIAVTVSPSTVRHLLSIGLSPQFNGNYLILLDSITFIIFFVVAVLIFQRRSDDPMAILVSGMLILTAMLYTAPGYEARAPMWMVAAGAALGETSHFAFLFTFPDSKFFPRWSWMILPPLFLWRFTVWLLAYLPILYGTFRMGEQYPVSVQAPLDLSLLMILYLFAISTQVYRYRTTSDTVQRQQMKWLVWGVGLAILIVGAYGLAMSMLPAMRSRSPDLITMRLVGRTVRQLALCVLPIALMYSILRFKLWNIDILINRTVVYIPLTSIMAGIFAASMVISQNFFLAVTGQRSDVGIIFTTLLLTTTFTPIRTKVQELVDKRFKEAPDPQRKLKQFDQQLRTVCDVIREPEMLRRLLQASVVSFDAAGGAIYIDEAGQPTLTHITPDWYGPVALQIPIERDGVRTGWLALGPRLSGEPYVADECLRLQDTLQRVSTVVQVFRPMSTASTPPGAAQQADRPGADEAEFVIPHLPLPQPGEPLQAQVVSLTSQL
jgi:hypothetical protein